MANEEEEDHFTDTDSDGDGPPEVFNEDWEEFVKKIESDDKMIKEIRDKNSKEIIDDFSEKNDEINRNLEYFSRFY